MPILIRPVVIFISLVFLTGIALGDDALFYKEVNLIGGYSDNDEWVGKSSSLLNSVGFEDYRKFSNDYGDYLTTDLQVRITYDSLEDSNNAWAAEIHNAWLQYKIMQGHNIKIGHFDPAFGLEPVLDTHGTILQTLAMKNIGFKKDWGVALKGYISEFDYKTALSLGSGMSVRREDGSYLWTGRIGSPSGGDFQYGVSLLYGETLESSGMKTFPRNDLLSEYAVLKKRIGLDGQYLFGSWLFKGEVAYGEDDSKSVIGGLAEIDYTLPDYQNVQLEFQCLSWLGDLDDSDSNDTTLTVGASYKFNQDITLRTAYSHDFNLAGGKEDDKVFIQVYYYGL